MATMPLPGIDRFVLGCGNFGGIGSAPELFGHGEDEPAAFALMDAAWELGIRWFDTADAYGGGRSEATIGKWIAATGNRPRLTTKTFNPMDSGHDSGLARERILRQIETSLERLGVERVDVYLAHAPDPETPLAETIGAFEELVADGRIGAYGVSNFGAAEFREALEVGRPSLLQNSYSLLDREAEPGVLGLCADNGVWFQAFSPLAGGWLTGKYRRGEEPPSGSRMTLRPDPYLHFRDERIYRALDALAAAAAHHGASMAGVALAWLAADARVSGIVIGPRRREHLEPVREALRLELPERGELSEAFER
jgi:aryl-alcohol dehydrogenase-like predicted oxidoreductase